MAVDPIAASALGRVKLAASLTRIENKPKRGSSVCRMHGAASGAPKGNKNALKHGGFTAEGLALKREIQALARMARETLVAIE